MAQSKANFGDCFQSWGAFWQLDCLGIVVGLPTLAIAAWEMVKWAVRFWQDRHVFAISIRDGFGPYENILAPKREFRLGIGKTVFFVFVKFRYLTHLYQPRITFVNDKKRHPVTTPLLPGFVRVESMLDYDAPPPVAHTTRTDGVMGAEGIYTGMPKGQGRYLKLQITAIAEKEWSGFLSFTELDRNGVPRFAYYPIRVSLTITPDIAPIP